MTAFDSFLNRRLIANVNSLIIKADLGIFLIRTKKLSNGELSNCLIESTVELSRYAELFPYQFPHHQPHS